MLHLNISPLKFKVVNAVLRHVFGMSLLIYSMSVCIQSWVEGKLSVMFELLKLPPSLRKVCNHRIFVLLEMLFQAAYSNPIIPFETDVCPISLFW